MRNKKFKKGSFVLVTNYSLRIESKIGIVLGYKGDKTVVYVIDIDFTIEVDDGYIKEV